MISAAEADPTDLKDLDQMKPASHQSGTMDSNHDGDLTARSVKEIDNHFATEKDDAATMAASEELKHTTISDDPHVSSTLYPSAKRFDPPGEDKDVTDKIRESTPETEPTDALDEQMKEKLSSPKKKRGRDTYDEMKELEGDYIDKTGPSADGSAVNGDRLEMEGPEKKRHRDTSEDPLKFSEKIAEAKVRVPNYPAQSCQHSNCFFCRKPHLAILQIPPRLHLPIPRHLKALFHPHQSQILVVFLAKNHKHLLRLLPIPASALLLRQAPPRSVLLTHQNLAFLVEMLIQLKLALARLVAQHHRVLPLL
jgi:hypothetical protein